MSTTPPKPRILVVEDDPTNALIAATICERIGCDVTVACNGHEALSLFDDQIFDLLLVDIQMPVMDGLTLARALRARPDGAGVPIIAVSAKAGVTDRHAMHAAGMDLVITKPYHNRQLKEAVNRALGRA